MLSCVHFIFVAWGSAVLGKIAPLATLKTELVTFFFHATAQTSLFVEFSFSAWTFKVSVALHI